MNDTSYLALVEKIKQCKGFIVAKDGQARHLSFDKSEEHFINYQDEQKSLEDFAFSFLKADKVTSHRIMDDSVLLVIGEPDNKQDACKLLHNMIDKAGIKPDFELISSLVGFNYSGEYEKQNEPLVTQFEYLKNKLLDIKYYISNEAEAKVLNILENTFSNILDKHESVLGEKIAKKPKIVIKGLLNDNQNNYDTKRTNMINKINVVIDMINSCKDTLNRESEEEHVKNSTELLEKLQAIKDLTNNLKEQLKTIEDQESKET